MLDKLPADQVRHNLDILSQLVQEQNPSIEVTRGPFYDRVLYYSAIFATQNQQRVAEAMRPLRLGKLMKEADSAPHELIDAVAANWRVTRVKGGYATGLVTILFPRATSVSIPSGTVFRNGTNTYVTKDTFIARTQGGTAMLKNDRVLRQTREGWAITVPVVSRHIGSAANIAKGSVFQTENLSVTIRRAYAESNFTGGADVETNQQVMNRLHQGVTMPTLSHRPGIEAVARAALPDCAYSIIGFGDPEMLRDRRNSWPGSTGGHVDLYVMPTGQKQVWSFTVPGVPSEEPGVWILDLPRYNAAGVYEVVGVHDSAGDPCMITKEKRGSTVHDFETHIDVRGGEGVFSATQTIQLHVVSARNRGGFTVDVCGVRGLSDVQRAVTNRDIANPAGDVLAYAATPCDVSVYIEIQQRLDHTDIDYAGMRALVVDSLHGTGFTGQLEAMKFMPAVTRMLGRNNVVRSITVGGKLKNPWDSLVLPPGNALVIPELPLSRTTPRTVGFYLAPEDVHIEVVPPG
jgi:hypothetical protein